jgi:hypothetical protein
LTVYFHCIEVNVKIEMLTVKECCEMVFTQRNTKPGFTEL